MTRTLPADPMRFVERVLTHENGEPLGRHLDPWQRADFLAALTTTRHVWWERPRGHSKSRDAAAVALADLVLGPPGQRIYFCATDQDQAALAFDSLRGFVRRSPVLAGSLRVLRREVVFDAHDSTCTVLPADAAGSWGLRPSLVIADELSQWRTAAHEEFFWSLWSSLGKVEGARLLVCLTAHWDRNGLAWRVREQVRDDPAWLFCVRQQCASWITAEFLEAQRRLLPAHLFEMLHENRWTEAGAEFLSWQEIDGIFDPAHQERREPLPGAQYVFGLDIATAKDRTALAVVRAEGNTAVVDALALWAGTPQQRVSLAEVEEVVAGLGWRFRPVQIVLDPFQGLLMADRLRKRGFLVKEYPFTTSSRAALFDTILQLIRQGRLRAFPHPVLREELVGLRWVEKGGMLRPDHSAAGHDDAVVAVALAARAMQEVPPEPGEVVVSIIGKERQEIVGGTVRINAAAII